MAYGTQSEKTFTVEAIPGGWIFVWADPAIDDEYDRSTSGGVSWPARSRPISTGRTVFTDRKKLMKQIDSFIASQAPS